MRLSVVLVNYNDRKHVADCLSSVEAAASEFDSEIIVVDNHSQDGSPADIARGFPRVRLILNNENLGFARANNQGWRESRGEFVLFLNTDTAVEPGALSLLAAELESKPEAGAIGPALLRKPGSFQVSFGRRVSFCSQAFQKLVLNPYYRILLKKNRKMREVGWLSAACLLVRRTALEHVGGFDEGFFIYFEDIDLCLRIKQAGWRLIYFPQARVMHRGGATTSPDLAASRYEYRRSQVYFYRKHNSKLALWLLFNSLKLKIRLLAWRGNFRGETGQRLHRQYQELLSAGNPRP